VRKIWREWIRSVFDSLCFNAFRIPLISLSVSVSFRPLAFSALSISVPIAVTVAIRDNFPTTAVIVIRVTGRGGWPRSRRWLRLLLLRLLLLLLLLLPDIAQLRPKRTDFFFVLLTNFAMLILELIERLTDYIQFVNLRGKTSVGLFLCAPEDRGVLEDGVEFLADDIERIVEACMATREAYGRLLNRLIWRTLGLQLLVLRKWIARR